MKYTERLKTLLKELNTGIYEKEEATRLVLLAFLSGKSCFLYGPPGTAKSLIARRVALAFQVGKADSNNASNTESNAFFAYLMNRFSTPEEIFGPIDIAELKQNRLTRSTQGYLPTAHFAFLDEIWKSSPAILNTLLTIINEKIYRDGNTDIKVPLKGLVCASNEFPVQNQGLEALYDRLVIRLCVLPVEKKESFEALLQAENDTEVVISNPFTLSELESITKQAKQVKFSKEALQAIHTLKGLIGSYNELLENQAQSSQDSNEQNAEAQNPQEMIAPTPNGIYISDRRWRAMAELLKSAAFLSDRKEVLPIDITLLSHCLWSDEAQRDVIQSLLAKALKDSIQNDEGVDDISSIESEYSKLYDTAIDEYYVQTQGEKEPKEVNEMTKRLYVEKCESLLESISSALERHNEKYNATQATMYNPFVSKSDYELVLQGILDSMQKATQLHIAIEQLKHIITHQPIPIPQKYGSTQDHSNEATQEATQEKPRKNADSQTSQKQPKYKPQTIQEAMEYIAKAQRGEIDWGDIDTSMIKNISSMLGTNLSGLFGRLK